MSVEIDNQLNRQMKKLERETTRAFDTVVTDIQRTSSGASPLDEGFLEKNHMKIEYGSNSWVGTVWFEAFNKNFDYAKWTHEEHYNLGPRSQAKAGGTSKYAGHVPVGRKYLHRTVDQGAESYRNLIAKSITDGLS